MNEPANQLVIAEREEISRGIRMLLGRPLITDRADPEIFDLIRRRRDPITKWFDYYCGWAVTVDPRLGYARLVKVRAATDPTRPARRRAGHAPFDRRRYLLFCVIAAELFAAPVTTIGLLADRVTAATTADPALPAFDSAQRGERTAFVDALRQLESFGAVHAIHGAIEQFVESGAAEVLFRVDSTLLMRLLAAPVGASRLNVPTEEVALRVGDVLDGITREYRYGRSGDSAAVAVSDVQHNLWLRHSVFRTLIDDPVVYFDELTADQRAYLTSVTGRQLLRRAADQGGFVLEERAEGLLFIDPEAIATDTRFPDDGAPATVAALLLLDGITGPTTIDRLTRSAGELFERFPQWARDYHSAEGTRRLVGDAVAALDSFGLATCTADGIVTPRPAASRYRVTEVRPSDSCEESPS